MEKKTKTVQFQKEKDTRNTEKFAEVQVQGEAPIIGSLYVQWFVGNAASLEVTVEGRGGHQKCPPLPFYGPDSGGLDRIGRRTRANLQ